YIDAFAPKDGQSLFDLVGPKAEGNMRAGAAKDGDGWRLPVNPMPPDTAPEDVAWASPRRRPQPIRTFEQKLQLTSKEPPPRHYIYATRNGPGDVFRQFAERAKSEAGWKHYEMDSSHNPHITCPDALMALLTRIMPNTWEDK
ncbi:MAG: alpha/beta hydrolase, partial [Rhodospirillales bacterium]|nr:alpha/beta hydrolase [Rhodospirillales bacterium]